jgi:lysozyme
MATVQSTVPVVSGFVKKWEGKPKYNKDGNMMAFDDGYGTPTIGWGATYYRDGSAVRMGDVITPEQGQDLYNYHIEVTANGIDELIDISRYSENELAAMISYAFTTGVTGFKNYGLMTAIEGGKRGDALKAVWTKSAITSKGVFSQGLVNRRKDEFNLFDDDWNPVTSYILRNEKTLSTTGLIVAGAVAVAMSVYIFIVIKKNKG